MDEALKIFPKPRYIPTPPSLLELYNVYRDYVKHEDHLILVRLERFLAAQAFLVAAFFVIVGKLVDNLSSVETKCSAAPLMLHVASRSISEPNLPHRMALIFLTFSAIVIAFLGARIAHSSQIAVNEADATHSRLQEQWELCARTDAQYFNLPGLHSAKYGKTLKYGPFGKFPYVFMWIWIVFFLVALAFSAYLIFPTIMTMLWLNALR